MNESGRSNLPSVPLSWSAAVLGRRWAVIAVTTIVAALIAGLGLLLATPSYQATVIMQTPITTGLQPVTDLTYIDRLLNTYQSLAQQPGFRAEVAHRLRQRHAPSVTVAAEPNTQLLKLTATDHSPATAQRDANAAAVVLMAQVTTLTHAATQAGQNAASAELSALANTIATQQLQLAALPLTPPYAAQRLVLEQSIRGNQLNYQTLVQQQAQLQLVTAAHSQPLMMVQPASRPTSPSSPRSGLIFALALAFGLIGGVALAYALERSRRGWYTVAAIESAADAAVLATIPSVNSGLNGTAIHNGDSRAEEAFGLMAAGLLAQTHARQLHTILITSPNRGDGKSIVSANLAVELATLAKKVLLVDADMHSASLHHTFNIPGNGGLSRILGDPDLPPDEYIVWSEDVPNLALLPAGPEPEASARLLSSGRLARMIKKLEQSWDYILFDAPPVTVIDALMIAPLVDMVLLVIPGSAPDRDIEIARRQLRSAGTQHVSIVLNRGRGREEPHPQAYSHPYSSGGS